MRAGGEAGGHPPFFMVSRPLAVASEASRGRERELERRAAQLRAENAELVLSALRGPRDGVVPSPRRYVTKFCQNGGKLLLVFDCIGTDLCQQIVLTK